MASLPSHQQLVGAHRWPVVGEQMPRADDSEWIVQVIGGVDLPQRYGVTQLSSGSLFELIELKLDIHCVTRWSKLDMRFQGLRLSELIAASHPNAAARFVSFGARSDREHSTSIPIELAPDTLVAFEVNGKPLAVEHGGPVRVVVPGRYFYKSLKWLETIELLATDRLGYWEAVAGYHNEADPWKEQRYVASSISKQHAAKLISSRNFSHQDLRGIDCTGRDLRRLNATGSLLRDGRFHSAKLSSASFRDSNLSNADFTNADLRDADFSAADVEGANFAGADLRGANLKVASMFGATFVLALSSGEYLMAKFDSNTEFDRAAFKSLADGQYEQISRLGLLDTQN